MSDEVEEKKMLGRILEECNEDRKELIPRLRDFHRCLSQLESRVEILEGQHYTLNNLTKEVKDNVDSALSSFKEKIDQKFEEKFEELHEKISPVLEEKKKRDAFLMKVGVAAIIIFIIIIPTLSMDEIKELIKALI